MEHRTVFTFNQDAPHLQFHLKGQIVLLMLQ